MLGTIGGVCVPTACLEKTIISPTLISHPLCSITLLNCSPALPPLLFRSLVKNANIFWSPCWETDLEDSMKNYILALSLNGPLWIQIVRQRK